MAAGVTGDISWPRRADKQAERPALTSFVAPVSSEAVALQSLRTRSYSAESRMSSGFDVCKYMKEVLEDGER